MIIFFVLYRVAPQKKKNERIKRSRKKRDLFIRVIPAERKIFHLYIFYRTRKQRGKIATSMKTTFSSLWKWKVVDIFVYHFPFNRNAYSLYIYIYIYLDCIVLLICSISLFYLHLLLSSKVWLQNSQAE